MPRLTNICVIVAARNAEATIGAAVVSALAQAEVTEVFVVDDASTDATAEAALESARNDRRLRILSLESNAGPAAARNLAIRASTAPFIAVLDADDWLLEGRFARLLALPGWDLAADNIAFVSSHGRPALGRQTDRAELLDLAAFIRGNISQRGVDRGELGFLKPVMRRSFLERHGLAYREELRLGEDYDLYVRCLLNGARFVVSHQVGYNARVRANSLSGRHRTRDLKALLEATDRHLAMSGQASPASAAMRAHQRQLKRRWLLRAFLDRKSEHGMGAALRFAASPPQRLFPIASGILTDKFATVAPGRSSRAPRPTLIPLSGSEPR